MEVNMEFDWITPREAAEEWGITDRRVQVLCKNGIVDGAIRMAVLFFVALRKWLINRFRPLS
jgi:hypothetical protein